MFIYKCYTLLKMKRADLKTSFFYTFLYDGAFFFKKNFKKKKKKMLNKN